MSHTELTVADLKISLSDLLQAREEQHHVNINKIEVLVATQALFIPTNIKTCLDSTCDAVCRALGYSHGVCISSSTCRCSN
ncbi:unnamed protein product [Arctia plantaginis]|uniref:Uncharacterized protein n=1 Tax=Arctia plantaginis TaxID=874455 RepID=A0A8S0Z855_ARCPL|nr:unnamed protein product [Arctia plantaginis]